MRLSHVQLLRRVYGLLLNKARPYSSVASTSYGSATAPTASYCASQVAGATITKQSTAALTWSNGLNIDYYLGIDLSTQTGYTSTAKLTFKFNAARRLCGTHDSPGGTPRRLVAK